MEADKRLDQIVHFKKQIQGQKDILRNRAEKMLEGLDETQSVSWIEGDLESMLNICKEIRTLEAQVQLLRAIYQSEQ